MARDDLRDFEIRMRLIDRKLTQLVAQADRLSQQALTPPIRTQLRIIQKRYDATLARAKARVEKEFKRWKALRP